MNKRLRIIMREGQQYIWDPKEYTEYDFCGRFFVVKHIDQWIGMYTIDEIFSVECRDV